MSAQDAQTEEAPQSFVKWSKLSSIISQAVKNGVKCAMYVKFFSFLQSCDIFSFLVL
jgi:hypothetical protein